MAPSPEVNPRDAVGRSKPQSTDVASVSAARRFAGRFGVDVVDDTVIVWLLAGVDVVAETLGAVIEQR
jgi:hypothetical protein